MSTNKSNIESLLQGYLILLPLGYIIISMFFLNIRRNFIIRLIFQFLFLLWLFIIIYYAFYRNNKIKLDNFKRKVIIIFIYIILISLLSFSLYQEQIREKGIVINVINHTDEYIEIMIEIDEDSMGHHFIEPNNNTGFKFIQYPIGKEYTVSIYLFNNSEIITSKSINTSENVNFEIHQNNTIIYSIE